MSRSKLNLKSREDPDKVSKAYEDAYDEALAELEDQGISVSLEPPKAQFNDGSYRGELPANLSELDLKDLGDLLAVTTIWSGYVSGLMALSSGMKVSMEKALKAAKANARMRFVDTEMKKYEVDDEIAIDVRVVELEQASLKNEVRYILLSKSICPSADSAFSAVSREISRRDQEQFKGTRSGNVSRRKPGSRTRR